MQTKLLFRSQDKRNAVVNSGSIPKNYNRNSNRFENGGLVIFKLKET